MELPGRCGDWLDTDTVKGFRFRLDTMTQGWGLCLAISGDSLPATCGGFLMAMDNRLTRYGRDSVEGNAN